MRSPSLLVFPCEREARARGDEFRRYTRRDVVEDPQPTVRELRRLLGAA